MRNVGVVLILYSSLITTSALAIIDGIPLPSNETQLAKTVVHLNILYKPSGFNFTVGGDCTGVYVSENMILTAEHCFREIMSGYDGRGTFSVAVSNETNLQNPNNWYGIDPIMDPESDLAVIPSMGQAPQTLSISTELPKDEIAISGYGYDRNSTDCFNFFMLLSSSDCASGAKKIGYTKIKSLDQAKWLSLPVSKIGKSNAHANAGRGDSGGPLLVWRNGSWFVAGIAHEMVISLDDTFYSRYSWLGSEPAKKFLIRVGLHYNP
jgi:hypothetical protein